MDSVTTPNHPNAKGEIAFTQLVNTVHRITADDEKSSKGILTSNGKFVLDDANGIQLGGTTRIENNDTKPHSKNDTPGQPVDDGLKKVSVKDEFELYLMYKPSGTDSIWVTLRMLKDDKLSTKEKLISWGWTASAIKVAKGMWNVEAGAVASKDPGSIDSIKLPEWSDFITNVKGADEK